MNAVTNRYDFVLFFDVENGNPNGDPDAGNLLRMDPETSQGLVTDVSLKRKLRNYVELIGGNRNNIFVREKEPLNPKIAKACEVLELPSFKLSEGKWDKKKAKDRPRREVHLIQEWLCSQNFDIRAFGGVLSTGPNGGQIRGPVQLTFARSIEAIMPAEHTITRLADVDKEEGEMGRKHVVPYGLYRAHGFINANLATRTGFSEEDLSLLWAGFRDMFGHDRSAARGMMAARRLIAFRHDSALGNAQAHKLFDRVTVERAYKGETQPVDDDRTHNWPVARAFTDYAIRLDETGLPDGVSVVEPF